MNRRSFFGLLAALPFVGLPRKKTLAEQVIEDTRRFTKGMTRTKQELFPNIPQYGAPYEFGANISFVRLEVKDIPENGRYWVVIAKHLIVAEREATSG